MTSNASRITKHAIFSIVTLILAIINSYFWQNPIFGTFCLTAFLVLTGILFNPIFNSEDRKINLLGLLITLSLISIFGSTLYYLSIITKEGMFLVAFIVLIISILFSIFRNKKLDYQNIKLKINYNPKSLFLFSLILISISAWWSVIYNIQITTPVRTLWSVVNPITIITLGITFFLVSLNLQLKKSNFAFISIITLFFSIISVASSVYVLGYGFDPFIHQATVSYIAQFGTITPKPFYYIGQYAIELFLLHGANLPIELIDRWLVPVFASIFITSSAWYGLSSIKKINNQTIGLEILSIFFLPLSIFITTTPQSLSYIFIINLVFLSIAKLIDSKSLPNWILILISITTLIIHPLAGIPAIIFTILILIKSANYFSQKIKLTLLTLIFLIGSLIMPIIFVIQSKISNLKINFSLINLDFTKINLNFFFENRFSTWLDGMYLIIDNLFWILILLAIIGYLFARKNNNLKKINIILLASIMWFINYVVLTLTLNFNFLIEYERANYADRLLTLTAIFLIPHIAIAINEIWKLIKNKHDKTLQIFFIMMITLIITAQIYGTYPRHDNYVRSASFNIGQNDITAVHLIEQIAEENKEDDNFIVLANQAVSSAALKEFGFKNYYHDNIFYYPIPTGGKLYNYYLKMTDEVPNRETMISAMNLAGVDLSFFVINDYWWQSTQIIENTKNQADDWFSVGDDAVTVFIFRR